MTFPSLGLSEPLLRAIADLGYVEPTPVQASAIPAILSGGDVWASAQTGSGKTAAFVLSILEALSKSAPLSPRRVCALIVVPTRELAVQIQGTIQALGRHLPHALKTCVAIGGGSINPQMMALRGGADLVVATPGRLLELVAENALSLAAVKTLVLDEADRLLSLGFADELARVLACLPVRRQNLLFSATFPPPVQALAERILHEPTEIDIDAGTTPDATVIVQRAIEVDASKRTPLLRQLLQTEGWSRVLVFVATQYGAEHVASKLARAGIPAKCLHGAMSQGARAQTLGDFKAKRLRVLVATDLAARGIDVEHLPVVVNYDLPRSSVDYLHRIGRTGRAGDTGIAVSFLGADSENHFRLIEMRHDLALPRERIAGFEPTDPPSPQDPHGGVKGKRKSKKDKLREAASGASIPKTRP